MRGPLTPRPVLSLRAYLPGLVVVCVLPVVAFSVWLILVLTAPGPCSLGRGCSCSARSVPRWPRVGRGDARLMVGPDQAGFMRFYQRELLPRVRAVLTG